MTKTELVKAVAEKTGLKKKEAAAAVEAFQATVVETVKKGEEVRLIGFGTFEQKKRAARTGKNPRTGEKIKIAASKYPAFKPGASFKAEVNKKRATKKK